MATLRLILSTFVLLAIVAVLVFDGASMLGAHRQAVHCADQAADQAAETFMASKGNEQVVHQTVEEMTASKGAQLIDLSYHRGTTRWYEVTVEVESESLLLRHIPFLKDRLAQQSTTIEHF